MTMIMRNDTVIQLTERKEKKRGFTLTEIAIVLGIIGLILGAIWVAASAVYQNLRLSRTQTELLQIVQAVRTMYATAVTTDPLANMPIGGPCTLGAANCTYITAGVFPVDALDTGNPATAINVRSPWGQNTNIAINAAQRNAANDSFVVTFNNIPLNACIQLLTSATGQGRDPGMWRAIGAAANTALPGVAVANLSAGAPLAASGTGCVLGAGALLSQAALYFEVRG